MALLPTSIAAIAGDIDTHLRRRKADSGPKHANRVGQIDRVLAIKYDIDRRTLCSIPRRSSDRPAGSWSLLFRAGSDGGEQNQKEDSDSPFHGMFSAMRFFLPQEGRGQIMRLLVSPNYCLPQEKSQGISQNGRRPIPQPFFERNSQQTRTLRGMIQPSLS